MITFAIVGSNGGVYLVAARTQAAAEEWFMRVGRLDVLDTQVFRGEIPPGQSVFEVT